MELPKRTKIAGGVLVLGLVALGYDRFAGSPEAASAATEPAGNTTPPEASAKPAAPVTANAAPQSVMTPCSGALADRLGELRLALPEEPARADAFSAPPEWFPAPVHKPITQAPKADEPKPVFKLTSVMKLGEARVAVIDNKKLMVGGEPGAKPKFPSEFQVKNTDGTTSTIRLVSADEKRGSAAIEIDGLEMELTLERGIKPDLHTDNPPSK